MPRGRRPIAWMKLYGSFLDSSINYEMDLAQQCIFLKLCLYSLRCGMEPGIIADNDGRAIPPWYIANCLHAPVEVVEETIKIGIATNRISQNGAGCLGIVNWKYYQSEYERQKPYREEKKQREYKDINIVYRSEGLVDENETAIFHNTLYSIRESLLGNRETTKANIRRFRETLRKLGISEKHGEDKILDNVE